MLGAQGLDFAFSAAQAAQENPEGPLPKPGLKSEEKVKP